MKKLEDLQKFVKYRLEEAKGEIDILIKRKGKANGFAYGKVSAFASINYQLIKILNIEKEIGGSGAASSNGDLHSVRECNVSGEAESTEAHVNGSLEKRTFDENICTGCYGTGINHGDESGKEACWGCNGKGTNVEAK